MIRRNSQNRLRRQAENASASSTSTTISAGAGRSRSNSRESAPNPLRAQLAEKRAKKATFGLFSSRKKFVKGKQKGDVMELADTKNLGSAVHFSDEVGDKVVTKLHPATPVVIQELMSKRAAFDDPRHVTDLATQLVKELGSLRSEGIRRELTELLDPTNIGAIQRFIDEQPLHRITADHFPFLQDKDLTAADQNTVNRQLSALMTSVFLRNIRARKIPDEIIIEPNDSRTPVDGKEADQVITDLIKDSNAEGLIKYRIETGSPAIDKNGNRRYRIEPDLADVPSDLLRTLVENSVFPDAVMANEKAQRSAYDSLFIRGANSIADFKILFPDLTTRFGDAIIRDLFGFQQFLWQQGEVEKQLGLLEKQLPEGATWLDVEAELSKAERAFGFTRKVVPDGVLPSDLFLSLPMLGFSVLDIGAGIEHGELTHRLQWFAYMTKTAEKGGEELVQPYDLYRAIGWRDFLEYSTGEQRDSVVNDREKRSLWAYLMDQVKKGASDVDNQRFRFPNDMLESLTNVGAERETPLPKLSAALAKRLGERRAAFIDVHLGNAGDEAGAEVNELLKRSGHQPLHPAGITELLPEGEKTRETVGNTYAKQMSQALEEIGQWAAKGKRSKSASNSSNDE